MTEAQKLAKAVQMFFKGGEFGDRDKQDWLALTGSDEATTKVLCDLARKVEALGDSLYLIWSHEHGGWWSTLSGYTPSLRRARVFGRMAAINQCRAAIPGTADRMGALPDLPVALVDVVAMAELYAQRFPDRKEAWQ